MSLFFFHCRYQSETFNSLGWVWTELNWGELERVLIFGVELRKFIHTAQQDGSTQVWIAFSLCLGALLAAWLDVKVKLEDFAKDLPTTTLRTQFLKKVAQRNEMFCVPFAKVGFKFLHLGILFDGQSLLWRTS